MYDTTCEVVIRCCDGVRVQSLESVVGGSGSCPVAGCCPVATTLTDSPVLSPESTPLSAWHPETMPTATPLPRSAGAVRADAEA